MTELRDQANGRREQRVRRHLTKGGCALPRSSAPRRAAASSKPVEGRGATQRLISRLARRWPQRGGTGGGGRPCRAARRWLLFIQLLDHHCPATGILPLVQRLEDDLDLLAHFQFVERDARRRCVGHAVRLTVNGDGPGDRIDVRDRPLHACALATPAGRATAAPKANPSVLGMVYPFRSRDVNASAECRSRDAACQASAHARMAGGGPGGGRREAAALPFQRTG
jgi:hypothetical protein